MAEKLGCRMIALGSKRPMNFLSWMTAMSRHAGPPVSGCSRLAGNATDWNSGWEYFNKCLEKGHAVARFAALNT